MQTSETALCEWGLFWHSDQLQSCSPANPDDIKKLSNVWASCFVAQASGSRILDLGCGNGSLAAQAVTVSQAKNLNFEIHGADLAEIEPSKFVGSAAEILKDISFHAKTNMEDLPFETASFDLVVSQYALEYTDVRLSLAEALRILRPGGQFCFLIHAQTSVLKDTCEWQGRQVTLLLESPLFSLTMALLKALNLAEQINSAATIRSAEAAITKLKQCFDRLEQKFKNEQERSLIDSLFNAVRRLPGLRKTTDLGTLLGMTEEIEILLRAQGKRLAAMAAAALDEKQISALAEQLLQEGAKEDVKEVKFEPATTGDIQHCVGYWLRGTLNVAS